LAGIRERKTSAALSFQRKLESSSPRRLRTPAFAGVTGNRTQFIFCRLEQVRCLHPEPDFGAVVEATAGEFAEPLRV
jgi:hypothetical protein